nr:TRAP transporter large permease [Amylibacter sp.]
MTLVDWILLGGSAFLLLLGVPYAFAIGLVSIAALVAIGVDPVVTVQQMVAGIDVFALLALPCFIIAGDLMHTGGLSNRLVKLAMVVARRFRGGVGMVAVLSAMMFGAISGSAPATTAAIGKLMIPEMEKRGYKRSFAAALAAAYGPIGILIPPSIPMVIWGVISNTSVPRMFFAGILPGVLMTAALVLVCNIHARWADIPRVDTRASLREFGLAIWDAKWALLAPVIILGGIYGGVFTPTEAGVIGITYGLLVGLFLHGELKWHMLSGIILRSVNTSASIAFVISIATVFGWIVAYEQLAERVAESIVNITDNRILILLLLNLFLLLVGMLMDTIAIMIVFSGFLVQLGAQLGIDPVHLGIMLIVNLGVGLMTPPFGYTLFTAAAISEVPFGKIVKSLWILVLVELAVVGLVTYIPAISLTLPALFMD